MKIVILWKKSSLLSISFNQGLPSIRFTFRPKFITNIKSLVRNIFFLLFMLEQLKAVFL